MSAAIYRVKMCVVSLLRACAGLVDVASLEAVKYMLRASDWVEALPPRA